MAEVKEGDRLFYKDLHNWLFNGDCRSMWELPDNSIQCVVTSPPYWGLRKYSGVPDLIWGDNHCEHRWGELLPCHHPGQVRDGKAVHNETTMGQTAPSGQFCSLCGAWEGSYGLEPQPEMYIQHTIEILREIRRVLRKDGVVFWNIGDSYAGSWGSMSKIPSRGAVPGRPPTAMPFKFDKQDYNKGMGGKSTHQGRTPATGMIKPKDLCLIPFRIAISAQEDGWWVRSVIIWSKPNPMPESVTDRPTESHEYILMLTKNAKYYWDADAVREQYAPATFERREYPDRGAKRYGEDRLCAGTGGSFRKLAETGLPQKEVIGFNPSGRNIRSVWEFPTQPYPEAHFAVFPEKLPEICIKAATPEEGCCSKCGAPWERVVGKSPSGGTRGTETYRAGVGGNRRDHSGRWDYDGATLGWQPTCKCQEGRRPSLVLDPFAGAGTTLWVAKRFNRKAIGYELSQEYCELALNRNRQQVFI